MMIKLISVSSFLISHYYVIRFMSYMDISVHYSLTLHNKFRQLEQRQRTYPYTTTTLKGWLHVLSQQMKIAADKPIVRNLETLKLGPQVY